MNHAVDPDLTVWLRQLCRQGSVDLEPLGGKRTSFLELLESCAIDYREGEARLEIEAPLELLDPEAIKAGLKPSNVGDATQWQYRLITESTNADVLRLFETCRKPAVALAEMQTGGRGRRGRSWLSPFARNIYCSIGLAKSISDCNPALLSIVTGIALVEALEDVGLGGLRLKWPNDLYFDHKKLGGILIESRSLSREEFFFAIGFGINVQMSAEDLAAIPQPATSTAAIAQTPVSRQTILVKAIQRVSDAVAEFSSSRLPELLERFASIDAFRDQEVQVRDGDEMVVGRNLGINPEGQLQLETAQGTRLFSAADVSLSR